jgi:hypothetical protein
MHPAARTSGLVVKTVGEEVLVYDVETHRAHSVNRVAAAVWRRCDGTRDAARIASEIQEDGVAPVTDEAVRYALAELWQARLLASPVAHAGITRRQLLRRVGTVAALPLVASIVVPTAAQAQSVQLCPVGTPNAGDPGLPNGAPCNVDVDCCSDICTNGVCVTP